MPVQSENFKLGSKTDNSEMTSVVIDTEQLQRRGRKEKKGKEKIERIFT